ncbi:hypothetical protein G6F68_020772 [Rhizopus microsporus]|nr:hypothetical protein G6F68_020772 [Rhizopus microsporus]
MVSRLGSNLSHSFDLPHYTPWWTVDRPKGIQEVEKEKDSDIPQLPNELPDLKTMTKQRKTVTMSSRYSANKQRAELR